MCNLYSVTKSQQAIRELYRVATDLTGNLPPMPGVFPDSPAPIVRNGPGGRELVKAHWGMPSPVFALQGKRTDPGVTNIRNVKSPHWRRWLDVENRCLVPFTSFSENEVLPDGRCPPVWFALGKDRPLACFAGIWVPGWTSVRKLKEGEVTADLFGFLTTEPNAEVGAVHPKAMPVILTTPEECDAWMSAPLSEALALQQPLPDGALIVVARGEKQDPPGRNGGRGIAAVTLKTFISSQVRLHKFCSHSRTFEEQRSLVRDPSNRCGSKCFSIPCYQTRLGR